jgi:hypothetical protein
LLVNLAILETDMTAPIDPTQAKPDQSPGDKSAQAPPSPAGQGVPASPTDGRLGPAADPAEGKRE